MSALTPGQYFYAKGITSTQLANRLETLPPLEREVLLARASGESLRQIAKRHGLTAEGVRYLENQAIAKIKNDLAKAPAKGSRFRQALEQRLGVSLEKALEGFPAREREVVLWHAGGFPLADLAPALKLSLSELIAVRDGVIERLSGAQAGSSAETWGEDKAAVLAVLREQSMTYEELAERLSLPKSRVTRLVKELVQENLADVSDELPLRFLVPGHTPQ